MKDMGFGLWRFIKIWLLLFFSFFIIRMAYNLGYLGYLDLRKFALLELLVIPTGQAVVFFLVTQPFARKRRNREAGNNPDNP